MFLNQFWESSNSQYKVQGSIYRSDCVRCFGCFGTERERERERDGR